MIGIDATINKFKEKYNEKVFDETEKQKIIDVAIGSIKYYELSKCRTTSYKFRFDEMLKYDGNTYTYITYFLARCNGIVTNYTEHYKKLPTQININEIEILDIKLLRKISHFSYILNKTYETQMPHHLCEYMNKLVSIGHECYSNQRCLFYDGNKNIIKCNETRIIIYNFVKKILELCFELFGIKIIDKLSAIPAKTKSMIETLANLALFDKKEKQHK